MSITTRIFTPSRVVAMSLAAAALTVASAIVPSALALYSRGRSVMQSEITDDKPVWCMQSWGYTEHGEIIMPGPSPTPAEKTDGYAELDALGQSTRRLEHATQVLTRSAQMVGRQRRTFGVPFRAMEYVLVHDRARTPRNTVEGGWALEPVNTMVTAVRVVPGRVLAAGFVANTATWFVVLAGAFAGAVVVVRRRRIWRGRCYLCGYLNDAPASRVCAECGAEKVELASRAPPAHTSQ